MCSFRFIFILFGVVWVLGILVLVQKQHDLKGGGPGILKTSADVRKIPQKPRIKQENGGQSGKQQQPNPRHNVPLQIVNDFEVAYEIPVDMKRRAVSFLSDFDEKQPPPQLAGMKEENEWTLPAQDSGDGKAFLTLFLTPRDGDKLKMKIQHNTIKAVSFLKSLGVSLVLFDYDEKDPDHKPEPTKRNSDSSKIDSKEADQYGWRELAALCNFSVLTGFPANPHGIPLPAPLPPNKQLD